MDQGYNIETSHQSKPLASSAGITCRDSPVDGTVQLDSRSRAANGYFQRLSFTRNIQQGSPMT